VSEPNIAVLMIMIRRNFRAGSHWVGNYGLYLLDILMTCNHMGTQIGGASDFDNANIICTNGLHVGDNFPAFLLSPRCVDLLLARPSLR
jgi:hypothetical protein